MQPASGSDSCAFGNWTSGIANGLVVPSGSLSASTMSMSLSPMSIPAEGPEMRMLMFSSGSSTVSPYSATANLATCWPGAHSRRNGVIAL